MKDIYLKQSVTATEKNDNTESEVFVDADLPEDPFVKFLMGESAKAKAAREEFCIEECPPIAVLGVGELGCAMLDSVGLTMRQPYITIALDIDREGARFNTFATRRLLVPNRIPAAKTDPDARDFVMRQEDAIGRLLAGLHTVILLTGLEGAAETKLSLVVAEILARRNMPTFAFAVTASESAVDLHKHDAAGLNELRGRVTALLEVPNKALEDSDANFDRAVLLAQQFTRVIASPAPTVGLMGIDVADLMTALSGGRTIVMGCGTGSGDNCGSDAMQAALSGMVLDEDNLYSADGVMILIEARHSFGLKQYSQAGEVIENFVREDAIVKVAWIPIKELEVDARVTVLARFSSDS